MAKKTATSRKGSTKKASKPAKAPAARKAAAKPAPVEPNVRQIFSEFKGRGNYSDFCKKNGLNLNETGAPLPIDATGEAFCKAANRANSDFSEASTRWAASAAYGKQHYNAHGFMHRDGLTRLNDQALALLMLQAGEELAQRSAFLGQAEASKRVNPAAAANYVAGISTWLAQRPDEIKSSRKAKAYEIVKADMEGKEGKVSTLALTSAAE